MDEIKDKYYDLNEFVEELSSLVNRYKGKVDNNYLEQIDAIWSEAIDERDDLEKIVDELEQAEQYELEFEYERSRI